MDGTDSRMIGLLERSGELSEVSRKTTTSFTGWRQTPRGRQCVTVDLFDCGANVAPALRYYAVATTEDGVRADGNNAPRVDAAISLLRWNELDTPPRPRRWGWTSE
jgi:hypothetical protein